jgi:WhiB family redox-sensing transcriptional regulator
MSTPTTLATTPRADSMKNVLAGTAELPCRAAPQLFFAEDPGQLLQAKALCRQCLVRRACLTDALRRREPCGVWGGELLDQGAIITGKRPRGRPPKRDPVRRDPVRRDPAA